MREPKQPQTAPLRARWLGHELRRLREQRGMTLRQVAGHLKRDFSALSRFENAEWQIPQDDVIRLLDLYGVANRRERARFRLMSEAAWQRDEWESEYADAIFDRTFCDVPWLEARATRIRAYDLTLVNGLLQIPEYIEALFRFDQPDASDAQIARWIDLRVFRQRVITGAEPTRFSCVVTESALRAVIGGPGVMRRQLLHLARQARRRHIEVRVLPLGCGVHAGLDGSFTIFELPAPFPAVAHVESLAGRMFVEPPRTEPFLRAYHRLRRTVLGAGESMRLITSIADRLG